MAVNLSTVVAVLAVYMVAVAIIGYIGWKRTDNTPEDYYLGDRNLGVFVLTGTVLATWFSTFAFLGGPGFFYSSGAGWLFFGLFNITGPLLIWVIGSRFWLLGQRFDHVTPSDLLAEFYEGDDVVRILTALIGIFALIPYATIQLSGVGKALVGLTGGSAPYWAGVVILTAMVAGYIYIGGLRAVAWTDVIQGFIFIGFLLLTSWFVIDWAGGLGAGFSAALEASPEKWTYQDNNPGAWYTGALVWTMAWVFIPHMWQRMLMAKNPRVIAKTAAISGTISLWAITFLGLIIGGIGAGLIPTLPEGQSADAIVPILYSEFFPAGGVLLTVAAFAAAMSTMGSQILTSSSLFVHDIVNRGLDVELSEERESRIGRIFIVVFAVVVLAFAMSPAGRRAIVPLASDGVALALLFIPPTLGLLFWEEASQAGARWSLLIGFVFMQAGIWTSFGNLFPYFGAPAWGLALTAVVYYGVSKMSDPVPREIQDEYRAVLHKGMSIREEPEARVGAPADD